MKEFYCTRCGDGYTSESLEELQEMGESFWIDRKTKHLICPECLDSFRRKDLEDRFDELMED